MLEPKSKLVKRAGQDSGPQSPPAVVPSSAEAIIGLDPGGNVTVWNLAAQRRFAEEVMGKSALELLCPPDLREPALEPLRKVAQGQGPFYLETQRRKEDGALIQASDNHADAAIAAHSLRGSAKIFGAAQMADLAAAVEQAADAAATEPAGAGLERLKAECERLSRELEQERARLPAAN